MEKFVKSKLLLSSQVPSLNRVSFSLRPQSPQFINAWVKTNSHPTAKWCRSSLMVLRLWWNWLWRWDLGDYNHNFTADLMLVIHLRTKSHLIFCLWAKGESAGFLIRAVDIQFQKKEKKLWSCILCKYDTECSDLQISNLYSIHSRT